MPVPTTYMPNCKDAVLENTNSVPADACAEEIDRVKL
jgi:hypothetical protein